MRIKRGDIDLFPLHVRIKIETTDKHEEIAAALKRALGGVGFKYAIGVATATSTHGMPITHEQEEIEDLMKCFEFLDAKDKAVVIGRNIEEILQGENIQRRTKNMEVGSVLLIIEEALLTENNVIKILRAMEENKPLLHFSALVSYER